MSLPSSPIPEENVPEEPGASLFAKLFLSLDTLAKQIERSNRLEQARLAMLPNYIPFARVSAPAGATDMIVFGGPQAGRQWTVRLLAALSSTLTTNAAIVHWFVGNPLGGNQPPPATEARWQFSSLPGFQSFTSDIIKVLPNQQLIAYLTNVPALSNIAVSCAVNDQTLYSQSTSVAVTE